MREAAFWSSFGRGAVLAAAMGAAAALAGCSSGGSRFDMPAMGMTGNPQASNGGYAADPATTASIPVPPESVYGGQGGAYASSQSYGAGYNNNRYASTGSYGGGSYNQPRQYGNTSSNSYGTRPTPASYQPQSGSYSSSSNRYPVQQAVYTPPSPPPAPKPAPQPTRRVASTTNQAFAGPGSKTITVQPGDSLYLYSLRYKVSVEAIQKANNLDDIRLTAGQKILIPASGTTVHGNSYIVRAGDSLNSIAKSQGVSEQKLAEVNNITDVRSLQIGQELILPKGGASAPSQVASSTPKPAPAPKPASTPAPAPSTSASNSNVRVVTTTKVEAPKFDEPKQTASQSAPAPRASSSAQTQASSSASSASSVASSTTLPAPDPMSGQRFRWPVNGRIVSKFGARSDGGHNDGIDMSVPQGTPVKAAENGVVAYAGDELKGYGNLVLVRHSNNWVTAYAHNEDLLVKRGDKVTRGQVIAKAGATGSVSQPQLHFELRKGSRPVDPLQYMSSATANAN
ncbi:LysM peptidoglycan-binding domain-containing M23 family metallopeptidase [Methyloligella sp. 2.7D]|uniref:LysM peptidoglycan-binding domain-containing M23 family metallopeptidase n=1 Tax=unclassified Methyloligella TaxID=2625955 RepID=UPI001FEE5FE2|nr:LysM peptidoglycan-binding domain-containing M23 family metallopeptidase [Methyloligella sp. GL2]